MFRRTVIAGIAFFASAAVLSELAHTADAVPASQQAPVATDDKVDFATQVEPLLSWFGCNAGAAMAKPAGRTASSCRSSALIPNSTTRPSSKKPAAGAFSARQPKTA